MMVVLSHELHARYITPSPTLWVLSRETLWSVAFDRMIQPCEVGPRAIPRHLAESRRVHLSQWQSRLRSEGETS